MSILQLFGIRNNFSVSEFSPLLVPLRTFIFEFCTRDTARSVLSGGGTVSERMTFVTAFL